MAFSEVSNHGEELNKQKAVAAKAVGSAMIPLQSLSRVLMRLRTLLVVELRGAPAQVRRAERGDVGYPGVCRGCGEGSEQGCGGPPSLHLP